MNELPPTSDKEFWTEIAVHEDYQLSPVEHVTKEVIHRVVQRGPYVVCVSCPYEHSLPVDLDVYHVVDGLVSKRK